MDREGPVSFYLLCAYHLRYAVPTSPLTSESLHAPNEIALEIGAETHQLPIQGYEAVRQR